MIRTFVSAAAIGAVLAPGAGRAQDVIELAEIVVIANLVETELDATGASVAVLTEEEIEATGGPTPERSTHPTTPWRP